MPTEEIQSDVQGNFPPMVSIREEGNYVKGKVIEKAQTKNGNPVVTLALIDLQGSTQKSVAKGVYAEVDVNVGDPVQVVGSTKVLKNVLPKLNIGDIATITFLGKKKIDGGKSLNEYKIEREK